VEESLVSADAAAGEVPGASKPPAPDATPTPGTRKPSGLHKAMQEGVTLKPFHIALLSAGGILVLAAVAAALFFGGVFDRQSTEGGPGPGEEREASGTPGDAGEDVEARAREILESARTLHGEGDLDGALAELERIEAGFPASGAAREAGSLKGAWKEEKRKAEARVEEVRRILEQVETLEARNRLDDAQAVLSRAVALDPDHPDVVKAGNRIRAALEAARSAKERKAAHDRYMTEADLARIRAEGSGKASDWSLVVEAASKAKANQDTEKARALLSLAKGKRDLAMAKESEAKGDLEEAIRLAALAGSHGARIEGLAGYAEGLRKKKAEAERLASRKRTFDRYASEAEAEEGRGEAGDPSVALALWKKALECADRAEDARKARSRIDALARAVSIRESSRRCDEAVSSARRALEAGTLDEAERLFREALTHVSRDPEALRGLREVEKARVEARYKKAMEEGRRSERRRDWKAAAEAYERALDAKRNDASARSALSRVKKNLSTLPRGLEEAFEVPAATRDQHGNPVATREGSRTDPDTGYPYEIWLRVGARRGVPLHMEFVLIPAGSFMMGSPESEEGRDSDEGPVHRVRIAKPFYLAKYEVTQGQWQAVMGNNPSHFKNAGDDAPVEKVSWNDCREFLKKLNSNVGAHGRAPLRLPTEAEWEYACRAGTRTALYSGKLIIKGKCNGPELDPISWYSGNSGVSYEGGYDSSGWPEKQYDHSRAGTHPVGGKKPNAWGLYDMIGNVWEWCEDVYDSEFYGKQEASRPNPLSTSGSSYRVARGGGWDGRAQGCRSAIRCGLDPSGRSRYLGFRPSRPLR